MAAVLARRSGALAGRTGSRESWAPSWRAGQIYVQFAGMPLTHARAALCQLCSARLCDKALTLLE